MGDCEDSQEPTALASLQCKDCMAFLRSPLDDLVNLGHKTGIYAVTQDALLQYLHLNRILLLGNQECKTADAHQVDDPEPSLVDGGFYRKQP